MTTLNLKYVLFDAGGTLLGTNTDVEHWYEQFFVDACTAEGFPVELAAVRRSLHAAVQTFAGEQRSSSPEQVRSFWEHVYGSAFADLVPGCDPLQLARHYIERFEEGEFVQLFSDTLPALKSLRDRGIRAGIVSNFGTYLELFLTKMGIAEYFEFVIISAAEGCEKPNPEIFHRALRYIALPPGQILFVGDSLREDYEASAALGFFAVLLDRWDKYADRPDLRRVRSLTGLLQFFPASE